MSNGLQTPTVLTNPVPFPAAPPIPWIPTTAQIADLQAIKAAYPTIHAETAFQQLKIAFPSRWTDNGIDRYTAYYNYNGV